VEAAYCPWHRKVVDADLADLLRKHPQAEATEVG